MLLYLTSLIFINRLKKEQLLMTLPSYKIESNYDKLKIVAAIPVRQENFSLTYCSIAAMNTFSLVSHCNNWGVFLYFTLAGDRVRSILQHSTKVNNIIVCKVVIWIIHLVCTQNFPKN